MPQFFSSNKNIYSVDMMFAYINLTKPKHIFITVNDLSHNMMFKGWGNFKTKHVYSPNDVLDNPLQYKDEINRINTSDLKYPIIVYNGNIVDGMHRLSKSILTNQTRIKAYVFDKELMTKFLVNKTGDWKKVDDIGIHQFIEMYVKKFT
jgi:disulfide oxidoreductase YuzD